MPTKRILIIDDNQDSAEMVAMLLSLSGHDVKVAVDGEEAIEVARAYHPEVVLLDLGLPGIDGYEVARRLQSEGLSGEMLVAVSGYGQPEDRLRTKAAGFDAHLIKPIDPTEVRKVVEQRRGVAAS